LSKTQTSSEFQTKTTEIRCVRSVPPRGRRRVLSCGCRVASWRRCLRMMRPTR